MSETIQTQHQYSKGVRLMLLITGGIGYNALMTTCYMVQAYYNLFQQGTGMNDAQLGLIGSMIGTIALFAYLFGGVLADIFSVKALMLISYFGGGATALFMSTMPSYGLFIVAQVLMCVFAVFTYWSAMAKFVKSLSTPKDEGKNYGLYYTGVGICGAFAGLVGARIVATSGGVAGLKMILYIYAAFAFIVGIITIIFYKNPKNIATDENERFKLKYVGYILKMPEVWLLGIAGACGYLINVANAYFAPLLEGTFGVSLAITTMLQTLRSFGIRMVIAPVSGTIIDKVGSTTKVMVYFLFAMLALMIVMLAMPWAPSWAWLAIAVLFLLAITYNMLTPTWFTPLSEIGIPDYMRGTAIGVTNALIFSSDAFMYGIASNMIAKNGTAGLRGLFIIILCAAVLGIICIFAVRSRLKAKKTHFSA